MFDCLMRWKTKSLSAECQGENSQNQHPLNENVCGKNTTGYSQRPVHAGAFIQHDRIDDAEQKQNKRGEKIEPSQNIGYGVYDWPAGSADIGNHEQRNQERMNRCQDAQWQQASAYFPKLLKTKKQDNRHDPICHNRPDHIMCFLYFCFPRSRPPQRQRAAFEQRGRYFNVWLWYHYCPVKVLGYDWQRRLLRYIKER